MRLQEFATPLGNFRNLRPVALAAEPPLIPPPGRNRRPINALFFIDFGLALIVKDLTFIEDGNPDYKDEKSKLLNCEKIFMLGKIVSRVRQIQNVYYQLAWVEVVHAYIDAVKLMSDDAMDEASKRLERKEV